MKSQNQIKNEIIDIIKDNINLKNNEIVWLPAIRNYNQSTSFILVLIDEIRNKK